MTPAFDKAEDNFSLEPNTKTETAQALNFRASESAPPDIGQTMAQAEDQTMDLTANTGLSGKPNPVINRNLIANSDNGQEPNDTAARCFYSPNQPFYWAHLRS